ncbi:MAG TPA: hypothetical protein VGA19_05930 [Rhodospirillales bacterium]
MGDRRPEAGGLELMGAVMGNWRRARSMTMALTMALGMAALLALAPAAATADQKSPGLDRLFERLKDAKNRSEADTAENAIWALWTHFGDKDVDTAMALGIAAMHSRDLQNALAFFNHVIKVAPNFAEGWNKRATAHYLMGDYDASVADIRRTLALEPRHFGALSGMGLIYDAIDKPAAAVKVWKRALEIHPHMRGIRQRMKDLDARAKGNPT